jgi:hypothetical protein
MDSKRNRKLEKQKRKLLKKNTELESDIFELNGVLDGRN